MVDVERRLSLPLEDMEEIIMRKKRWEARARLAAAAAAANPNAAAARAATNPQVAAAGTAVASPDARGCDDPGGVAAVDFHARGLSDFGRTSGELWGRSSSTPQTSGELGRDPGHFWRNGMRGASRRAALRGGRDAFWEEYADEADIGRHFELGKREGDEFLGRSALGQAFSSARRRLDSSVRDLEGVGVVAAAATGGAAAEGKRLLQGLGQKTRELASGLEEKTRELSSSMEGKTQQLTLGLEGRTREVASCLQEKTKELTSAAGALGESSSKLLDSLRGSCEESLSALNQEGRLKRELVLDAAAQFRQQAAVFCAQAAEAGVTLAASAVVQIEQSADQLSHDFEKAKVQIGRVGVQAGYAAAGLVDEMHDALDDKICWLQEASRGAVQDDIAAMVRARIAHADVALRDWQARVPSWVVEFHEGFQHQLAPAAADAARTASLKLQQAAPMAAVELEKLQLRGLETLGRLEQSRPKLPEGAQKFLDAFAGLYLLGPLQAAAETISGALSQKLVQFTALKNKVKWGRKLREAKGFSRRLGDAELRGAWESRQGDDAWAAIRMSMLEREREERMFRVGLGQGIVTALLTQALYIFLRSKLDACSDLKIRINSEGNDLLSGRLPSISITAREARYKGISLSDVDLAASAIAFRRRGQNLLNDSFPVHAYISMSAEDLNSSLGSPLLLPILRSVFSLAERQPMPALQVALGEGFLEFIAVNEERALSSLTRGSTSSSSSTSSRYLSPLTPQKLPPPPSSDMPSPPLPHTPRPLRNLRIGSRVFSNKLQSPVSSEGYLTPRSPFSPFASQALGEAPFSPRGDDNGREVLWTPRRWVRKKPVQALALQVSLSEDGRKLSIRQLNKSLTQCAGPKDFLLDGICRRFCPGEKSQVAEFSEATAREIDLGPHTLLTQLEVSPNGLKCRGRFLLSTK